MSTQSLQSHSIKLSSLQLLVDKGSSGVTAAKARNSVRQTGASVNVIKQRDFVTAGVTAVSVVIIRIENCVQILKLITAFSDCYFIIVTTYE